MSFELDPLIEDEAAGLEHAQRVNRYVELGQQWSRGQQNRLIKVPATRAGLDALEPLAAAGVSLNVTLMFVERQYQMARDAIWRGAQRHQNGLRDFNKYVEAFAGGDILTNPPATNDAVEHSPKDYLRHIDQMPAEGVLREIDDKVDMAKLERVLMEEGVKKFADPQKKLLALIAQQRTAKLAATGRAHR